MVLYLNSPTRSCDGSLSGKATRVIPPGHYIKTSCATSPASYEMIPRVKHVERETNFRVNAYKYTSAPLRLHDVVSTCRLSVSMLVAVKCKNWYNSLLSAYTLSCFARLVRLDLDIAVFRDIHSVFVWYVISNVSEEMLLPSPLLKLSQVSNVAVYIISYWTWIASIRVWFVLQTAGFWPLV
jgi:hypothetical protein